MFSFPETESVRKKSSIRLPILRYALVILFVGVGFYWSFLLRPFFAYGFLPMLLIAVMASAWIGGAGPGLFAVLMSSVGVDYFFFAPVHNLRLSADALPYFLLFLASALAMNWLSVLQKNAGQKQQAHLDELFEQAPEAIMLLGLQSTILRVNKEFTRIFGYSPEEARGRSGTALLVPGDLQREAEMIREELNSGKTVNLETIRKRKDGSPVAVSELAVPIIVDGERISDYVIYRDISGRKKAAESLQKAQAELAHLSRVTTMGELVASIAHEVNQPIAAVVTNGSAAVRWLAMNPPHLEEVREALTWIVEDANRAGAVIARIRALIAKHAHEKTRLDINGVIRDVLLLTEAEIRRADVNLQSKLAGDVPPVLGDRIQLQQVILNLIMNALDAMTGITERPRELLIASSHDTTNVLIIVQDSGAGFEGQDPEQIFQPFFTTKSQGLGMGLSISRSIVEAHGGRLWASSAPIHGAIFQCTLPKDIPSHE